jgi:hypothetical protein
MEATVKNPTPFLALVAVLALTLACGGCDDDPKRPPAPGSVEGVVTRIDPPPAPPAATGDDAPNADALADIQTLYPVNDAYVVLVDVENLTVATEVQLTGENGGYSFDGLQPGQYAPLVLHRTLVVREKSAPTIIIESNETTTHNINMAQFELLSDRRYYIEGTVTEAGTGEPVAGAHVGAALATAGEFAHYCGGVGTLWAGVTDSLGYYNVPAFTFNIQGSDWMVPLTATKEGYEPNTVIGDGPEFADVIPPTYPRPTEGEFGLHVDIELEPLVGGSGPQGTGSITGRLRSFGVPVPGVTIGASLAFVSEPDTFRSPPASNVPVPARTTRSDANGYFMINGLTPGQYFVDPAYCASDGYLLDTMSEALDTRCVVLEGQVCNVGEINLLMAIDPVAPANRSAVQDTTPEFQWTAVSVPEGMDFIGYSIEYGTGYVMDSHMTEIMETSWQIPISEAFSPGDYVRWNVVARAYDPGTRRNILIGEFEWPATFSVAE